MDELVLFSGGPDSTILLIDLLKKKVPVRVLYLELGWCADQYGRLPIQAQVVEKVLKYINIHYGGDMAIRKTIFMMNVCKII